MNKWIVIVIIAVWALVVSGISKADFFGDRLVDAIKTVSTKNSKAKPLQLTHTEEGDKRALNVGFANVPSVSVGAFNDSYLSSFGDLAVVEYTPKSQISAQYGILSDMEQFVGDDIGTGGTVTVEDNMFVVSTDAVVGGYGVVRSEHPVLYREGQGLMGRFTAIFDETNAAANSLQAAGMFNLQDTIAFGYWGADFGVILQHYGQPEIRTLTITAATSGVLTLTLNGVAYPVTLTAGSNALNAYEIQAELAHAQNVWAVTQVGDTVIFQARSTGAKSGTYSVSGAGISATFAQNEAGADKTTTFVAQSDWSEGPASWLSPSGLNIYMIKLSYLGFGPFKFFAINPNTGRYELVHIMHNQTIFTKPSISNRALKVGWIAASLGTSNSLTVKGASAGMFIAGKDEVLKHPKSIGATNTAVSTTHEHILTVKVSQVFKNKVFLGLIKPINLAASTDSTKDVELLVIKNASFQSNATNFAYVDSSDSATLYDATGVFNVNASYKASFRTTIGAGGSSRIDLKPFDLDLSLGETLSFFAKVSSGSASSVTVDLSWKEDI